jgi:hypothetical protein
VCVVRPSRPEPVPNYQCGGTASTSICPHHGPVPLPSRSSPLFDTSSWARDVTLQLGCAFSKVISDKGDARDLWVDVLW